MTSNHVSSDNEPLPLNPTCLSNFLASGCPPIRPVSDVPVDLPKNYVQDDDDVVLKSLAEDDATVLSPATTS